MTDLIDADDPLQKLKAWFSAPLSEMGVHNVTEPQVHDGELWTAFCTDSLRKIDQLIAEQAEHTHERHVAFTESVLRALDADEQKITELFRHRAFNQVVAEIVTELEQQEAARCNQVGGEMTTARKMADDEGAFASPLIEELERHCPKCGRSAQMHYELWHPSDGGLPDCKFTCPVCGHYWWVDGGDS